MGTMKLIGILFLATFASLIGAASNAQQVAARPREKAEAGTSERQQYQEKIEAKLRELDREIAELKAEAAKQSRDAGKEVDQQVPELERKYEVARQKYEKFKNSSQGAWQDMKAGIDAAMKDLQAAYNRAALHFK
jgi:inorganic triphosphatase YgiF